MSVVERLRPTTARRRWALLGTAAAAWFVLYLINRPFWDWLVYDVAGLDPDGRLGSGVHFFFYDSVKILLLLTGIVFVITVARSFLSVERTRALLGGRRQGVGNVAAAGLGAATPFCSCSAVPAFIGFVAAGVPVGLTMSFLIASPLVDGVTIALLLGLFGLGPTLMYVGAGLSVAVIAGMILGRVRPERWIEPFVLQTRLHGQVIDSTAGLTWDDRIEMGIEEVRTILRKIWPFLLVGIGLGAVIHGWAPEDFFATYAGADNPFGVLIAVGLGVPLYSNAAGILPLVGAMADKGLPMGTLLAFMMAVVALSVPEIILLRRVLKPPLIGAFIGITAAGIITVGYLFNALL